MMPAGTPAVTAVVLITVVAMAAAACSDHAQQRDIDGMTLRVSTDPSLPEVGRPARFAAALYRAGEPVGNCELRLRQYMPGMEMRGDDIWYPMTAATSGAYHATSGDFSMGGDWQVAIAITCGGQTQTATFDYRLEWPE